MLEFLQIFTVIVLIGIYALTAVGLLFTNWIGRIITFLMVCFGYAFEIFALNHHYF